MAMKNSLPQSFLASTESEPLKDLSQDHLSCPLYLVVVVVMVYGSSSPADLLALHHSRGLSSRLSPLLLAGHMHILPLCPLPPTSLLSVLSQPQYSAG